MSDANLNNTIAHFILNVVKPVTAKYQLELNDFPPPLCNLLCREIIEKKRTFKQAMDFADLSCFVISAYKNGKLPKI